MKYRVLELFGLSGDQINEIWELLKAEIQFGRVVWSKSGVWFTLSYLTNDEYYALKSLYSEHCESR